MSENKQFGDHVSCAHAQNVAHDQIWHMIKKFNQEIDVGEKFKIGVQKFLF